jgi:hypothetical protein
MAFDLSYFIKWKANIYPHSLATKARVASAVLAAPVDSLAD